MTTTRLLILFLSCCALSALSFWTVDRFLVASPYQENDHLPWDGFLEYEGRPFDGVIPMVVHVIGRDAGQVFTQEYSEVAVRGGLFRVILGCLGSSCSESEKLPRWATTQQNVRIEVQLFGDLLANDHRIGTIPQAAEADRYGTLQVRGDMNVSGGLSAAGVQASEADVAGDLGIEGAMNLGPRRGSDTTLDIGGNLLMPAGTLRAASALLVGNNPQIRNPETAQLRFASGTNHGSAGVVLNLAPSGSGFSGNVDANSLLVRGTSNNLTVADSGGSVLIRRTGGGPLVLGDPTDTVFVASNVNLQVNSGMPGFRVTEHRDLGFGSGASTSSAFGNSAREICWLSQVDMEPRSLVQSNISGSQRNCPSFDDCGLPFACRIEETGNGQYHMVRQVFDSSQNRSAIRRCGAVCLELPGGIQ